MTAGVGVIEFPPELRDSQAEHVVSSGNSDGSLNRTDT